MLAPRTDKSGSADDRSTSALMTVSLFGTNTKFSGVGSSADTFSGNSAELRHRSVAWTGILASRCKRSHFFTTHKLYRTDAEII